jgi:hypothetical protein
MRKSSALVLEPERLSRIPPSCAIEDTARRSRRQRRITHITPVAVLMPFCQADSVEGG